MDINSQVNVKPCEQCQGDTEYCCKTCGLNICPLCKSKHNISIDTKHHDVVPYKFKNNFLYKPKMCVTHPGQLYELYCEPCDLPVCYFCKEHRTHKVQILTKTFERKFKENDKCVVNIRSDILYNTKVQYAESRCDISTCQNVMFKCQFSKMVKKSEILKNSFDYAPSEVRANYLRLLLWKVYQQLVQINNHLSEVKKYETKYEHYSNSPVQFLRFVSTVHIPRTQDTPILSLRCLLTISQEVSMENLIKVLSEIKITRMKKRQPPSIDRLLTLMPKAVLQRSFLVPCVERCFHISCVTPNRIWVSDINDINLIDTDTGKKIHSVEGAFNGHAGKHSVNTFGELLYINRQNSINILSNDMKTNATLITTPDPKSEAMCVYCSSLSGDILVAMRLNSVSKIMRYDKTGRLIQTLPHENSQQALYSWPHFITENNNFDVVVSENKKVMVTTSEGIYRFTYKVPLSGYFKGISGICTDALSHILVCDTDKQRIHMLDKNGQFLSYLLAMYSPGIQEPQSLCYDINTHQLWVGSWDNNTVSVYRYIDRHTDFPGKFYHLL